MAVIDEQNNPVRIVLSYAHEDERERNDLLGHLANLIDHQKRAQLWSDLRIAPGSNWKEEIDRAFQSAELILLLITSDFMKSEFIRTEELKTALERQQRGEVEVIPIIVKDGDYHGAPFVHLQTLPALDKPVLSGAREYRDEAWATVARGIRASCESIRTRASYREAPAVGMGRVGSDDRLLPHHLCDRRPQLDAFKTHVTRYLRAPITGPRLFVVHGPESGDFDLMFSRLDQALHEMVEKEPRYLKVFPYLWTSPPERAGSTPAEISGKYVKDVYNEHGLLEKESQKFLIKRLGEHAEEVVRIRLKWSAAQLSGKVESHLDSIIQFARSWYPRIAIPVIWEVGIEYQSGKGRGLFGSSWNLRPSRDGKIREWLLRCQPTGSGEESRERLVVLEELGGVTGKDGDDWTDEIAALLKLDLDRRRRLRGQVRKYFAEDCRGEPVEMFPLVSKLEEFITQIEGVANGAGIRRQT